MRIPMIIDLPALLYCGVSDFHHFRVRGHSSPYNPTMRTIQRESPDPAEVCSNVPNATCNTLPMFVSPIVYSKAKELIRLIILVELEELSLTQ